MANQDKWLGLLDAPQSQRQILAHRPQRQDGAWDVTLSIAPHDELNTSRGTGATFNDAWGNMAPLWA